MQPIEKLLCPEPRGVLSLTGGGGKTSLMFHLARLLVDSGKRVLTTTTTRIFVPTAEQSATVLIDPDPARILQQAVDCRAVTAGRAVEDGKLMGFAPETIDTLAAAAIFDWILVEADGSARRPLKAPAGHEPVIPKSTTVLVAVAGLEAIGAPLSEELVFRSELAGPLLGLAQGEIITEAAIARLFAHPLGSFKGAPPHAHRFIFLNKADNPARCATGARIADQLRLLDQPVARALLVGQSLETIRIRAVHPLAVPS